MVDIRAIKSIMRKDLVDAGIEPGVYLDQKSKVDKVFCVHCGTLIPDIVNEKGYTPESRLARCSTCGVTMHAGCAVWKGKGKRPFCTGCIGPYPTSGSVSAVSGKTLAMSGSVSGKNTIIHSGYNRDTIILTRRTI